MSLYLIFEKKYIQIRLFHHMNYILLKFILPLMYQGIELNFYQVYLLFQSFPINDRQEYFFHDQYEQLYKNFLCIFHLIFQKIYGQFLFSQFLYFAAIF